MTPLEVVIAALQDHGSKPRRSGGGWIAKCPVHDDRNPSLSVSEGREQPVLAHCFGCDAGFPEIMGALGLSLADVMSRDGWTAVHPYGPSTVKVRRDQRGRNPARAWYSAERDGIHRRQSPDSDPLYRMENLALARDDGSPIWLCEGESDTDAAVAAGARAVGVPHGAGTWRDEWSGLFQGLHVIVAHDDDDAGHKGAAKAMESLQGVAASVVRAVPTRGKDVQAHLAARGRLAELRYVFAGWAALGRWLGPERLDEPRAGAADRAGSGAGSRSVPAGDPATDGDDTGQGGEDDDESPPFWATSVSGADLGTMTFPPVRCLIADLIPAGGVVLLGGRPKVGKSLLAQGLAVAVATSGTALGRRKAEQGDVLYISLDDASLARMQRRVRAITGGTVPEALTVHVEPNLGVGRRAAENLHAYLERHPDCRMVVIDTLEHLRGEKAAGESAYSADVRFLAAIRSVAARHADVVFLCLVHVRKSDGGDDDDPISAISGTYGITAGADAVLVLTGRRGAPLRVLDVISRDSDEARLALSMDAQGRLTITDDDANDPAVLMTPDDARVYRAVREFPNGATAMDLGPALTGVNGIGDRLARLARHGYLTKRSRGVYVA